MGISMIEMIDNRLFNIFKDPEIQEISLFSFENLRDCILMSILKDAYYETEPKQSLRSLRGSDQDDIRMRDSRGKAYAQHYRNLQYEYIKENLGIDVPELLSDDVKEMDGKLSGYKLTRMQYFEMNTIADHPLLKAIVSKRICDVKKISNEVFLDYMADYDNLTSGLVKMLDGSDEDVVFATIALFTLEWKYNVEFFYSCAVNAEKYGTTEIPKDKVAVLCAELSMPVPDDPFERLHVESKFILHRASLVPSVYSASEEEWSGIYDRLWLYFVAQYYIRRDIVRKWDMAGFFARYTTREEWAYFFRKHYDLRKIYVKKEWNNKRIRYVRKLYKTMLKDMETPKL